MNVPAFDLSRQNEVLGGELRAVFDRVVKSGQFVLGAEVDALEKEVAAYVSARLGIGCASGTDALWLALRACDVGPGDVVLTSSFTFFATASAIAGTGATPAFVDIAPDSFLIEPAAARRALEGKDPVLQRLGVRPESIKAVIPVHLYGEPVDVAALRKAVGPSCKVIEDGAQAIGASIDGTHAGVLGEIGCFSFFPTKNLGAFGDGGLVTTNDDALAARLRLLRAHGSKVKYQHDVLGTNSRLDALQAALLRVKLRHLPAWTARRQALATRYTAALAGIAGLVLPSTPPGVVHVFHQYTVRAPGRRDALRAHLEGCGIASTVYYPIPAHLQPALAALGYKAGDLPLAERASGEVLSLPIFPELTDAEQDTVVSAIRDFFAVS